MFVDHDGHCSDLCSKVGHNSTPLPAPAIDSHLLHSKTPHKASLRRNKKQLSGHLRLFLTGLQIGLATPSRISVATFRTFELVD